MNARPVTILSLIQIFLIVSVFILVGLFMKLHGYPDARPWPFLPIFVRENILYALIIAVAWAGITVYSATKPSYLYKGMIVAGAVFAVVIAFFGTSAIYLALAGPKRPLMSIQK